VAALVSLAQAKAVSYDTTHGMISVKTIFFPLMTDMGSDLMYLPVRLRLFCIAVTTCHERLQKCPLGWAEGAFQPSCFFSPFIGTPEYPHPLFRTVRSLHAESIGLGESASNWATFVFLGQKDFFSRQNHHLHVYVTGT
jgi:hypothetical protein